MTTTKTHADFTKYPKIFSQVYWGAFEGESAKDIIDNRNDFIKEFNIKSRYRFPQYMWKKYGVFTDRHWVDEKATLGKWIIPPMNKRCKLDHIEIYKTRDNKCVIVNSPYSVSEAEEEKILELGYVKYKPLYNSMATTYIHIVPIGRY